ncbi:MAG: DUF3198 domain-containing protein [Euryarchaeota archaeon]|jgi:amino acid transporter|nr:DUF3198 domain-containing protein [Euryarchaeota archaeon]MVT14365.1 DUF3198 domain-containing protein [Euryarchaeota archaeon]MVT35345.1 DUF3198 domain-containing protein [Euryarchaeota archaeon]
MMNWRIWREYIIYLSFILMVLGFILLAFSTLGIFSSSPPSYVKDFHNYIGDWIYWIFVLSIALFLIGLYYFYDTLKKLKKFKEYINSDSKSKFLKNLKELEIISYKLGPKHEEMLEEKKREWKIH